MYGGIFSWSLSWPDGASCYVGNMSNIAVACEPVSPLAITPLALWQKCICGRLREFYHFRHMVIRYAHALCGNSHQNILLRDSCFREADPTTWSVTCVLAAFTPLYRPDIPLALRYLQQYHNMRPRRCQTCIPYFLHLYSMLLILLQSRVIPAHSDPTVLFCEALIVQARYRRQAPLS